MQKLRDQQDVNVGATRGYTGARAGMTFSAERVFLKENCF